MSHRLNTSHGGTLRVALTQATEWGSTQASVSAMAKLRQRNEFLWFFCKSMRQGLSRMYILWPAMRKWTVCNFLWNSCFGHGSRQNLWSSMVKEPGSKKVPRPSYGQKIVPRSPVPQFTIIEKRSVLYIHSSTFNVSVYTPYNTTQPHFWWPQSASTAILVLRIRYWEKRWTLHLVSCLWLFVQLRLHVINTPGCGSSTTWNTSGLYVLFGMNYSCEKPCPCSSKLVSHWGCTVMCMSTYTIL